jgi:hypothetical protein
MKAFVYWLTIPRLLVAILFISIFTMAVRIPADTDTWWHLRSGQYIVENQIIFTTDPFSHTHEGQLWMYPKLGQVFWYGLFVLGGWIGLSLGLATLVTGAFGLVWQVTPGNQYIRVFATILGVITSSLIWIARPQMFSFLLSGLLLFWLERYKRTGSRWIYTLPLITVLWTNVHGGYAIAFMLLAVYLVGETLNRLTNHSDDPVLSWRQIGILMGVALVSLVVVAINPHGWQMWTYPFRTVGIGALRDFIQEWRSPDFHTAITWPFVIMLLLTLVAMGCISRSVDWTDLTLVGLWAVWSLFAVRNIGLYGLLTIPVLARYSDVALEQFLPVSKKLFSSQHPVLTYFNWLLLGVVSLAALVRINLTLFSLSTTAIEQENLPTEAVHFIQENKPPGPLFNSYNWGGYLIFKLWPEYPVYIDGRTDLYEDSFIRHYLNVMVAGDGWQQTLDEDRINLVLIESNSVLAKSLGHDLAWTEIYRDEIAVIFVRKTTAP